MNIIFIGAGNLATSLAPALQKTGHTIMQIYSPTTTSAQALALALNCSYTTLRNDILPAADVYIYSIRDTAYPFDCVISRSDAVHLLTAGSIPYTAINQAQNAGVFYPFQTFSKLKPITDFQQIPILIEGANNYTLSIARQLAKSISLQVYESTEQSRLRLHLAGVLANNFTNCLYALAKEQLDKANLPFSLLLPLIDETAEKVHSLQPRQAQTGPAVRHDQAVIDKHLQLLPLEQQTLYRIFTQNIQSFS